MTILLICLIPVAGLLSFFTCAILQAASAADRQEERYFAELQARREETKRNRTEEDMPEGNPAETEDKR
jgi:hypothetical protein